MVTKSVYFSYQISLKKKKLKKNPQIHFLFVLLFCFVFYKFFGLCSIIYIDFYEKVNGLTFVQSGFFSF